MKRMMEKGKGKRRTQTNCRAYKRRKFAALSTREAEETKADHRNNLQHTEAARMLPALGFWFHTRFRYKFRFGFGTNCWAALRRGWRLGGTAGLSRSRAACCPTTGGIPWSGRLNENMKTREHRKWPENRAINLQCHQFCEYFLSDTHLVEALEILLPLCVGSSG